VKLINASQRVNNDMFHGLKAEMEHSRMLFPITLRRNEINVIEKNK